VDDDAIGRRLQWATIIWNVAEVFVTIGLGIAAGSLALVAFGLDSLIEVFASLVVLWHMEPAAAEDRAGRDNRARRLVAVAFGVLAAYLLIAAVRSLWVGDEPEGSPIGIAYLAATAAVMFALARAKRRVGQRLESEPFIAEASMTFLDGCLAVAILTALALNAALGWWWADPLAALIVSMVAANEARELLDSPTVTSTGPRSTGA
jgi:divalent metal cation (Fe/Co/Zn/Cd) transporter